MSKHTPGPWAYALEYGPSITELPRITTVARCANYVIGLPSEYPGGNYRDGDPSGDEEADARLIAAAPELLEALKEERRIRLIGQSPECGQSHWESMRDLRRAAYEATDAAIAKATGEKA